MQQSRLARFPLLREKGFELHPPMADLALEAGDSYSFIYGGHKIITIFDGSDWRFVYDELVGIQYDFDTSVVTIL